MSQVHTPGTEAWLQARDRERARRCAAAYRRRYPPSKPSARQRFLTSAALGLLSMGMLALPVPHQAQPPPRPHASQLGLAATVSRLNGLALFEAQRQRDAALAQDQDLTTQLTAATAARDDLKTQVEQLKQQVASLQVLTRGLGSRGVITSSSNLTGAAGNHFAFGYCTWYVANEWQWLYGRWIPWLGNAIEWWANARSLGYAEGPTPRIGAIMVSRDSWWGHVALVTSVFADGSWLVNEMNWNAWDAVDSRHVYPGGTLVGFIYL